MPAKDIKKNDYLVRYAGRSSTCTDLDVIDLAPFSDKYDENHVYEKHPRNNKLNINTICFLTGLSRNYLYSLKYKKNVKFRSHAKRERLDNYLQSINKTFDDFVQNSYFYEVKYDRYLKIDNHFCYIFGFYLGNGWIHNTSIGLALHSENNKPQLELIKNYFFKYLSRIGIHKNKKLIQFYIKSKILCTLFKNLVPGAGSDKKIPYDFLNLPDEKLKSLFKGLIDSDGNTRMEDGSLRQAFDNTSIELIYQFRQIVENLGYICKISKRKQDGCSESYKVSFQERSKYTTTGYNDGKYIYIKVKDIREIDCDGHVYDLSIKNNPSYHTDNFIVHNSSACSLILYLIGCTNIDPVLYDLYFTRFVSEARAKSKTINGIVYVNGKTMPDCDSDISYNDREKVLKYIEERYKGKTSKIGTHSRLTGKLLIKEVSKVVLEYQEEDAKRLSDLIEKHFGVVQTLESTYKNIPEFKKWVDTSAENKRCYLIACSLTDSIKNRGVHPSGIAVSFEKIDEFLPLELSSSKDIVTSYNMDEVSVQVVKLDILGLKTVDVIADSCKCININPEDIDVNDQSIYEYLKTKNEFYGLFQIEDGLSKKVIQEVRPRNIHDLAACISISRPGALAYIGDYKKFVNNGEVKSFHPSIDESLKQTGNIIIYQEQINKICMEVYGLSPEDSDEIRRIIGKKVDEEMPKWEPIIKNAGLNKGIPVEVTNKFWETIKQSGKYLFNAGHAYSYGSICAQTTYIKSNYPKEFFVSLLRMAKFEPNPIEVISKINQELRHFGITLLPPHILHSDIDFKVIGDDIMFGLGSIKGVSDKTIEKLNKFRHPHSNKFEIFVGAKEAGLSIGVLSSLILVGAIDANNRPKLVYEAQLFNLLTAKEKRYVLEYGIQFNFDLVKCLKHLRLSKDEKGKPIIKDSRYETLKKHETPYKKMLDFNSKHEDLGKYYFERFLLGYAYSINLIDIYKNVVPDIITIEEVNGCLEKEKVHFVGEVSNVISRKGKESGRKYLKAEIQDHTGICSVLLCDTDKAWKVQEHHEENAGTMKEGDIVFVRGSKGENIIFAKKIGVQPIEIFDKISKIKNMDKSTLENQPINQNN